MRKITQTIFPIMAIHFLAWACVPPMHVPAPTSTNPQEVATSQTGSWERAEFRGLRLGESTYDDVKRLWGNPRWEGENTEKLFDEAEILLQYSALGDGVGATDVIVGEKTRVIKALSYVPSASLHRDDIRKKYGNEYLAIESGESMCTASKRQHRKSAGDSAGPVILLYPKKGMYVLLDGQGVVMHLGFSYKCLD
jgi:hypothetical protein